LEYMLTSLRDGIVDGYEKVIVRWGTNILLQMIID